MSRYTSSQRAKTNHHMNPVNLNETLKDHIRNYRIRLDDINENLNYINTVNATTPSSNANNFIVSEFIDELTGQRNSSEHELHARIDHQSNSIPSSQQQQQQLLVKREKSSNKLNSVTKSISVIDLSDLTEPDPRKSVNYNAFRPMRLNEYIKNTRTKQSKTLAAFVHEKQQHQQQHQQQQQQFISRMAETAISSKYSMQPALSESFIKHNISSSFINNKTASSSDGVGGDHVIKANSNPVLSAIVNNDTSELFRREYSITNDSSHNSSMMIVSKKRVSFHEQVLETDVVSGNSTLKPIVNFKFKNY